MNKINELELEAYPLYLHFNHIFTFIFTYDRQSHFSFIQVVYLSI